MVKHRKQNPKGPRADGQSRPAVAHPPARRPKLLAVSIVLLLIWFVFLLVTALRVGL
jgi:hypothetical protein